MVKKEESNAWKKYKSRFQTAITSVNNLKAQVIMKRAKRMSLRKAVDLTNDEADRILRDVGAFQLTSRGYEEVNTIQQWRKFGFPIIKKVSENQIYKKWKVLVK